MPRAKHKGPFIDDRLMGKVKLALDRRDKKPIKTWSRRSTITPEFVGLQFSVHNGKDFINVLVASVVKKVSAKHIKNTVLRLRALPLIQN